MYLGRSGRKNPATVSGGTTKEAWRERWEKRVGTVTPENITLKISSEGTSFGVRSHFRFQGGRRGWVPLRGWEEAWGTSETKSVRLERRSVGNGKRETGEPKETTLAGVVGSRTEDRKGGRKVCG